MLRRLALVGLVLLALSPASGKKSGYAEVDRYALAAPAVATRSVDELAAYLKRVGPSHQERSRAVYRWIAGNISYDTQGLFSDSLPDQSARATLERRNGVCAGYANLFEALGRRCGLNVVTIGGEIRRDPQDPTGEERSHAWNAVQLQGRWHLVDPTWGSGYVDYKNRRFVRKFNPYYYLVPPEQLIFSHIPDDKSWQLLPSPKTVKEIEALPHVTSYYFRYDVRPGLRRGALSVDKSVELKLQAAPEVRLSASVYRHENEELENQALVQHDGKTWVVNALFPRKGDYKVVIWGTDDPTSDTFSYVMDYRVNVKQGTDARFPMFSGDFLTRRARVETPLSERLPANKKVKFSIHVPEAEDVQLISGESWQPLERKGQWFRGTLTVPKGQAHLSARFPGNQTYRLLLRYRAD